MRSFRDNKPVQIVVGITLSLIWAIGLFIGAKPFVTTLVYLILFANVTASDYLDLGLVLLGSVIYIAPIVALREAIKDKLAWFSKSLVWTGVLMIILALLIHFTWLNDISFYLHFLT